MKIDFKKLKIQITKPSASNRVNPHSHWAILLNIFFIVITILILFSFFLLYKIKTQQIFQVEIKTEASPSIIKEKLLDRVNEYFDNKSLKENEIKNGLKTYQDPSL